MRRSATPSRVHWSVRRWRLDRGRCPGRRASRNPADALLDRAREALRRARVLRHGAARLARRRSPALRATIAGRGRRRWAAGGGRAGRRGAGPCVDARGRSAGRRCGPTRGDPGAERRREVPDVGREPARSIAGRPTRELVGAPRAVGSSNGSSFDRDVRAWSWAGTATTPTDASVLRDAIPSRSATCGRRWGETAAPPLGRWRSDAPMRTSGRSRPSGSATGSCSCAANRVGSDGDPASVQRRRVRALGVHTRRGLGLGRAAGRWPRRAIRVGERPGTTRRRRARSSSGSPERERSPA